MESTNGPPFALSNQIVADHPNIPVFENVTRYKNGNRLIIFETFQ